MDKHNLSIFLVVKTEEKQNIITGKCYRLLKKKNRILLWPVVQETLIVNVRPSAYANSNVVWQMAQG